MYRLKSQFRGKNIAIAKPTVTLSDGFLGNGSNKAFIEANLADLAKFIERMDGEPIEGVKEAVEVENVDVIDSITSSDYTVRELKEVLGTITDLETLDRFKAGEERASALKLIEAHAENL